MLRTTPGSHPGYLRYLRPPGGGWYDPTMADEEERPPAADRVDEREHPAQPPQRGEGFGEGQEEIPEPPDQEKIRDFGEGQERDPDSPEEEHIGRFSEGQEELPETPEKEIERDFAEGQEESPPGSA
jgi:hypothetical protein